MFNKEQVIEKVKILVDVFGAGNLTIGFGASMVLQDIKETSRDVDVGIASSSYPAFQQLQERLATSETNESFLFGNTFLSELVSEEIPMHIEGFGYDIYIRDDIHMGLKDYECEYNLDYNVMLQTPKSILTIKLIWNRLKDQEDIEILSTLLCKRNLRYDDLNETLDSLKNLRVDWENGYRKDLMAFADPNQTKHLEDVMVTKKTIADLALVIKDLENEIIELKNERKRFMKDLYE